MLDPTTQAALNGTLTSPSWGTGLSGYFNLVNGLPVPLYLYAVDDVGNQIPYTGTGTTPLLLPANDSTPVAFTTDIYYILRNALTGAFVTVMMTALQGASTPQGPLMAVAVGPMNLLPPNQIGSYPKPNQDMPLPTDTPRVLVGAGMMATSPSGILVREQFWQRSGDSYTLAPGTKRTVSTTLVSGVQNTSSHQDAVSKSLGLSGSFGWGPVSASISANLSSTSTSFQQVTVSSESTQYESLELKNDTKHTQMYLRWQLTDVLTVFLPASSTNMPAPTDPIFPPPSNGPGGYTPVTSVQIAQSPVLIGGPYNPDRLPAAPAPHPAMSAAAAAAVQARRLNRTVMLTAPAASGGKRKAPSRRR